MKCLIHCQYSIVRYTSMNRDTRNGKIAINDVNKKLL